VEFCSSDPGIAMIFDGETIWDLIEVCPQECLQVSFAAHPMAWMNDQPVTASDSPCDSL